MTTYVFPGQGSQAKGMGSALFSEFPEYVQTANNILGYSIETLCLEDPENKLNQTNYTQPALYVVNALTYFKKLKDTNMEPDYVAGHSLGEYNALLAAKVFDFETGLKLVQKRGELMSKATGGGMAAVVGLQSEKVEEILREKQLKNITIANYNSSTQVVITGPKEEVGAAEPHFINAGALLFMLLKVSGAFHSPYMNSARDEFEKFLKNFIFSPPKIPVIANITAEPYKGDNVAESLAAQITSPVKWTQTITYLLAQGETVFEEIGPGKVLTGLIARIKKGQ